VYIHKVLEVIQQWSYLARFVYKNFPECSNTQAKSLPLGKPSAQVAVALNENLCSKKHFLDKVAVHMCKYDFIITITFYNYHQKWYNYNYKTFVRILCSILEMVNVVSTKGQSGLVLRQN
jgi:hypothetical protein